MSDEKKVREVAVCVRTILKSRGNDVKVKDIVSLIQDEDLGDPIALSQKVENDLKTLKAVKAVPAVSSPNQRREDIATFMVDNWDAIKDNESVRSALLHGYSMGRIKKDERNRLQSELLARCESDTVVNTAPSPAVAARVQSAVVNTVDEGDDDVVEEESQKFDF